MHFSVLSSGSRANCTFIKSKSTKILIDFGLSVRETNLRLNSLGESLEEISAVFITHEHSDHIRGLNTLINRYGIPIFINKKTFSTLPFKEDNFQFFNTGEEFNFGKLKIHPISIEHDAIEPVGFIINSEGKKLSHITDIGKITTLVKNNLEGSDSIVIEANHDYDMLMECDYPWALKQRISSTQGHLSNSDCGSLLKEIIHTDLNNIVLGHLSKNSNNPVIARKTVLTSIAELPERMRECTLTCAGELEATEMLKV